MLRRKKNNNKTSAEPTGRTWVDLFLLAWHGLSGEDGRYFRVRLAIVFVAFAILSGFVTCRVYIQPRFYAKQASEMVYEIAEQRKTDAPVSDVIKLRERQRNVCGYLQQQMKLPAWIKLFDPEQSYSDIRCRDLIEFDRSDKRAGEGNGPVFRPKW